MKKKLLKFYWQSGQIEKANQISNQYFFLEGKVLIGNKQSNLINFPSLNVCYEIANFSLKMGCYLTLTLVRNKYYYGLTCLLEKNTKYVFSYTYLENFSEKVYHEKIKIYFLLFYRENVPFSNWKEMKKILIQDLEQLKTKPKINWEKIY